MLITFRDCHSDVIYLIPLGHQEIQVRPRQTQFQIRLDETKIGGITIETVDAYDKVRTFRREESILIADVEVRQGRGQALIVTKRHIGS